MILTELSLRLPNSAGAAASVCQLLAGERVNILAMALDAGGHFRLVVDNHTRAVGVLRDEHRTVTTREVLYVPVGPGPGGAAVVLEMLGAAGVNVDCLYGGADDAGVVVIGVDDPLRAAAATGL